jgi:hypothetical protein
MLVRPDVKERQRDLSRRRTRALRQRKQAAKRSKGNQRRCYRVWMDDSDVVKLIDELKLAQQLDTQLTPREVRAAIDRQWMEVVGRVIEQAALLAIRKR